jgi:hypothetical protein
MWESLVPVTHAPPMSEEVMKAMVVTCLAWDWETEALLLVLSFYMLLRPCEAICATPKMFSSLRALSQPLLLGIENAKTSLRAARQQYARMEPSNATDFARSCLLRRPRCDRLWISCSATWARRLAALCRALELTATYTPQSPRTGGASHFFQVWQEDIPRLMWRGRWANQRMLAHYVQELAVASIRAHEDSSRVGILAGLFDRTLSEHV